MSYEVDVGNIGSFTLSQGRRHDPETGRQMLMH
jgi:hypothetical protein